MLAPFTSSVEHRLSPWVNLVEKWVQWPGRREPEVYHAFAQADYVSVLAVDRDGRVPLVRQFRPGCGEFTLELPGGMLETGESPETCARRELYEEVGARDGELTFLGVLWPDPGRLTNRLHCFFAKGVAVQETGWTEESGLERQFVDAQELTKLVRDARLCNAHHVALVGLAQAAGLFIC
jgi:8-oxo-dGTP pyrophosphatase MutT (NUDIX family)